ncbi:MAG: exosortase system-associated protein, TIGR04073 family [Candidatus Omnitrophica bacterium]|nr:exosortase system-associated protein, TIGR04073 family [Candidatus Omnitrophota bacterium]
MKKVSIFIVAVLLIVVVVSSGYCSGPAEKLSRGISNILTFPCEIPYQISETNKQNGLTTAIGYGTLKGIFMAGVRVLMGVYEVITFPIPAPGNFEPIMTDPEFFFNSK